MSNTGKKIVLTLKQVNSITFAPTGLTEPNDPSNPDYIPPYTDYVECPLSYSLACPNSIITGYTGLMGFEFSVYNSVINNPQVNQILVTAISNSIGINSASFSLPNVTPNYFSGSISLPPGSYNLRVEYKSGSISLTSCNPTSSIIVS